MTDGSVKQAVLDELGWEPSVDETHIGVTAKGGVVTLSGYVGSYSEKVSAEEAVGRVSGVRAIADELEVRYPGEAPNDDDIAKKVLQVLSWDIDVPDDKIKAKVEKGWVTLSGEVEWYYQRSAAESPCSATADCRFL